MVRAPDVKTRDAPSGDQPRPPTFRSSRATVNSRPSAIVRTTMSPALTNATRDPSGDGTIAVSAAGVVHTADAAPPSIGTRQRSPFFATISARPSLLQNAPLS